MPWKPRDADLGDFWFLHGPDALHLYYLILGSDVRHGFRNEGIGHATSTDGLHWTEQEPIMYRGGPGAFDEAAIYTGSAIERGGRYYTLYTGLGAADHLQRSGLLVSDDLWHWERVSEDPVLKPDARWYEVAEDWTGGKWVSWRDPWLWNNPEDGMCYAFVTATERRDAPRHARGCIGLARSRDMRRWEVLPPVSAPALFHDHEVPQVFELGGRWYLIYLMCLWRYSDLAWRTRSHDRWLEGTYYLVSDHPLGPWRVPEHDVLAGCRNHAPLAARVQQVGDDLLFYAWGPRRLALGPPMRLEAGGDGRLTACWWPGVEACLAEDVCSGRPEPRSGAWEEGTPPAGRAQGVAAVAGYGVEVTDFVATATAEPGPGAMPGLGVSDGQSTLAGLVDRPAGVARIMRLPQRHVLGETPIAVPPSGPISLRLVADGDVLTLFLNDEFTTAAFIENRPPGEVRLVSERGGTVFKAVSGRVLRL